MNLPNVPFRLTSLFGYKARLLLKYKLIFILFGKPAALRMLKKYGLTQRARINDLYEVQMELEWRTGKPPEWFDHHIDLYHTWGFNGSNSFWLERGVFGGLTIKRGGDLLELCCGDGFNTAHFYANIARKVVAIDFDPSSIDHASRYNGKSNVDYRVADIRTQMPEGNFDNIVWDAAIEHFTQEEIIAIMLEIKKRLGKNGILSGYTVIKNETGKMHEDHEYEFETKADLIRFVAPYFEHVVVFETDHPERRNLYFFASDGIVPFDHNWPMMEKK